MAVSVTLAPYAVRIREKRSKDYLPLDNLWDGTGLSTLLQDYLTQRQAERQIDEDSHAVIRADHHTIDGDVIEGVLRSGKYGFEAELENVHTGEVKNRGIDDCELIPLFFRFQFRPGQNEGLLFLQRYGIYGVKSMLQSDLTCYLRSHNADAVLELNPLVTDDAIEELLGGGIQSIEYIKFMVPDDVANDCRLDDNIEEIGLMETVIKAKRGHRIPIPQWIRDVASGQAQVSNLIEIKDVQYDEVKIRVDVNGSLKTVGLADISKFRMNLNVTDEIEMGDNGHPAYESLAVKASELASQFENALGWCND